MQVTRLFCDHAGVYIQCGTRRPEKVVQIDTLTKSYVVDPRIIGDAIKARLPVPELPFILPVKIDYRVAGNHKGTVLVGHVFGHPTLPDGMQITSSPITGFRLESQEEGLTGLGQLRAQGLIHDGRTVPLPLSEAANFPVRRPGPPTPL